MTITCRSAHVAALVSLALLSACAAATREQAGRGENALRDRSAAHVPPPPKHADIDLPEVVVVASPLEERALGELDETQLFDCGVRAFDAADWNRAAACFSRLADAFPASERVGAATFNSALSLERLQRYGDALARWEADIALIVAAEKSRAPKDAALKPTSDEIDATFHAAFAEHELGRLDAAATRLKTLSERPGIPDSRKGEALVQQAVCLVERAEHARKAGERDPALLAGRGDAEHLLRAALELYAKAGTDGEADPALLAQAEFWIGEIYRSYFDETTLDPGTQNEKALGAALETKAQFLLSAQGHYLRAIRRGDGEWATASGYRIGELYESLHQQMIDAPMPKLTHDEVAVYREELKKKVRVLIEKAMKIYEQTLATAERVNAQSDYVRKTHEALERMRAMLIEEKPHAAAPGAAPAPRVN